MWSKISFKLDSRINSVLSRMQSTGGRINKESVE